MMEETDARQTGLERLLFAVGRVVVPRENRAEWARTWRAELWYLHHTRSGERLAQTQESLGAGLILDALWLRTHSWQRALRGTACSCLLGLSAACLLALLAGWAGGSGLLVFQTRLAVFLLEAPLVTVVTFATISRRHLHGGGTAVDLILRTRRQGFLVVKSALVLTLSLLCSADFAQPARAAAPLASALLQMLLCAVFAILGLRWAILDQEERCKHCLLLLTSPTRVGRPSHNLLEWNGTEQVCRKGHGRLSSPEMETSWCSHSRWLAARQDQLVS